MHLLSIFFLLKFIISVKGILEILSRDTDLIMEQHLISLTNYILANYFSQYKCVAFVIDKTSRLNPSYILENIQLNVPIVKIEATEEPLGTNWTAMLERYQMGRENIEPWTTPDLIIQALDNQCRGIIIQTDRAQEYMEIIPHLYKVANYKSDRQYLFLPRTANGQHPNLHEIFQLQECGFVRDVLFVLPVNDSCYQLTTHLFDSIQLDAQQILGNYCPEDEDIWQPPNVYKKLFPNKMKDLRGRPLRFSSFTYPPYHIIDFENKTYDGLEIRIIKEVARRHNGTIMGLPVLDGQMWGDLYLETMNATGLLGRLWRFEVEFSVGSYYTYEFTNRYLDQSVFYLRGAMHCVAPKPDVVFDWLGPMLPFTSEMWIALGVTLIVVPIALSAITRATIRLVGRRLARMPYYFIGSSLLYTLAMLVSQSPPDDPQGPASAPIDHFVIWLLCAFLLISNAYSSGLSAILTIQRTEDPIDTIYDLDSHKINWLAPHEAFLFALLPSTEPAVIRVMGLFKIASEIEMEKFLQDPKTRYAYAIEVLANGNYAMGPFIQTWSMARLRLMKDYLYYGWVSVMTNKGSPYTDSLNEIIFRLRESGILLYWEGDTARATIGTRRILAVANSLLKETPPVMPLQWHHIQGTMLVLFFGCLLATLAFIGERFSRKRKRNGKLL